MTAPTPQYATSVKGDVLVNQTACGVDLNALWDEFRDLLDVWNKERTGLTDLLVSTPPSVPRLCRRTVKWRRLRKPPSLASQKSANIPGNGLLVGYRFRDYDGSS